jgi:D-inositol-3-phosphate glycosyltransferase
VAMTMPTRDGVRRVAVLAYHSSPLEEPGVGDAGGMGVYVRAVAAAHAAAGIHTDIFTRATSRLGGTVKVSPRVRVIEIGGGPRQRLPKEVLPQYIPEFASNLKAFAATQHITYDVLHSHYWQSGLAGLPLRRAWNASLVHSQHTLGLVKNRHLPAGDSPEPEARIRGEERVIRDADVLIASTDDEWQQLSCLYGAGHDRLKTVHPGVDHSTFKPGDRAAARDRYGLPGDEPVLLCVGRIQPLKGLEVALEATAELIRFLKRDVTLVIVGGPSGAAGERYLQRLRKRAVDLGLQERVRFIGPRPRADLPDFYRAAEALVVCSRYESFGLTALEAQACGVPVVGAAVGGLTHVVRNGVSGWIVGDSRPQAYARTLASLLTDEARHRSFSEAAVVAARGFTWRRTGEELLELYDCLVRASAPEVCTC